MITTAVTNSAKQEFLHGIHQPGDVYKIALYTGEASLGAKTTEYSGTNEVKGDGYDAGGKELSGHSVSLDGSTAILSFDPATWPLSTITARGALIYNSSQGNKAVAVFDFGSDVTSTNGPFVATMPERTAEAGLIRIT